MLKHGQWAGPWGTELRDNLSKETNKSVNMFFPEGRHIPFNSQWIVIMDKIRSQWSRKTSSSTSNGFCRPFRVFGDWGIIGNGTVWTEVFSEMVLLFPRFVKGKLVSSRYFSRLGAISFFLSTCLNVRGHGQHLINQTTRRMRSRQNVFQTWKEHQKSV